MRHQLDVSKAMTRLYLVVDGDKISLDLVMKEHPSISYPERTGAAKVNRMSPREAVLAAWDVLIPEDGGTND